LCIKNSLLARVGTRGKGLVLKYKDYPREGGRRSIKKCKTISLDAPEIELEFLKMRLLDKVADASDKEACWEWQGASSPNGYGRMKALGRVEGVHRVSYMLFNGPLTERYPIVMHSCDNKACVNPSHLVAGDDSQNMLDYMEKSGKRRAV